MFACYFPTAWDPDAEVEELYELISLFQDNQQSANATAFFGGDFNARIGGLQPQDDCMHVGPYGSGTRNDRGSMLVRWIMGQNLQILNRMKGAHNNWTCERYGDGAKVQIDFLLAQLHVDVLDAWNDFALPTGIDHRWAHCIVGIAMPKRPAKRKSRTNHKGWTPHVDEFGRAAIFHDELTTWLRNTSEPTFEQLEGALGKAGLKGGCSFEKRCKFKPSNALRQLRCRRRLAPDFNECRDLSLQIRKTHARELSAFKSRRCAQYLQSTKHWKALGRLQLAPRQLPIPPPADDFADMLSRLFSGAVVEPVKPAFLEDAPLFDARVDEGNPKSKVEQGL